MLERKLELPEVFSDCCIIYLNAINFLDELKIKRSSV